MNDAVVADGAVPAEPGDGQAAGRKPWQPPAFEVVPVRTAAGDFFADGDTGFSS